MDSESNSHQQTSLTEEFDAAPAEDSSEASPSDTQIKALVDDYITSKQTSGSQAYASTAGSVLHRWAAWMIDQNHSGAEG
jgi:hypothetical protein